MINLWGDEVCSKWRDDFSAFHKDMGDRPEGKVRHRLDPNKDFEPGNVIWASPEEVRNNNRRSVMLTFKSERKSIADWVKESFVQKLNLRDVTLYNRRQKGWTDEEALTIPRGKKRKRFQ
jgi:hypothetical protein